MELVTSLRILSETNPIRLRAYIPTILTMKAKSWLAVMISTFIAIAMAPAVLVSVLTNQTALALAFLVSVLTN